MSVNVELLEAKVKIYEDTLGKIEDPRKRDHREPDLYTERGCIMHMASEALRKGKELEEQYRGKVE